MPQLIATHFRLERAGYSGNCESLVAMKARLVSASEHVQHDAGCRRCQIPLSWMLLRSRPAFQLFAGNTSISAANIKSLEG